MAQEETETNRIHDALVKLLEHPHVAIPIGTDLPSKERVPMMLRMEQEQLAEATGFGSLMKLTANGIKIARIPGGYKGHLKELADAKTKEDRRSTINTHIAFWASAFGGLSFLATIYTIVDSNDTSEKLLITNARIDSTNTRMARLQTQLRVSDSLAAAQRQINATPKITSPTPTKASPLLTPAQTPIQ